LTDFVWKNISSVFFNLSLHTQAQLYIALCEQASFLLQEKLRCGCQFALTLPTHSAQHKMAASSSQISLFFCHQEKAAPLLQKSTGLQHCSEPSKQIISARVTKLLNIATNNISQREETG